MILYRSDGRILSMLVSKGFEGSPAMSLLQSRKYLEEYLGANSTRNLAGHNWGNDTKLISTGTNKDCAGQTGGKSDHHKYVWRYRPVYQFTIRNFDPREISVTTLGFTPKTIKAFPPILYMNAPTLSKATMFGLRRRKNAEEITMFTSIAFSRFTGIASIGEIKPHMQNKTDNALTGYNGRKLPMV